MSPNLQVERPAGGLQVRRADAHDSDAIVRLNERLTRGGQAYQLPTDPRLPGEARHRPAAFPVFRELLVAAEGPEIRAGMLQYHSSIFVAGSEREFCWAHLPVSEGLVDRRYAMVIFLLVKTAFADQPFQMCLGVGSLQETWARLLEKLGWQHATVPFLFDPVRPSRVLQGLAYLQRRRKWKISAAILRRSGLAALSGQGLAARRWLSDRAQRCESQLETRFGDWADRVFEGARPFYGATARRDATTLNLLYPPEDARFARIRVRSEHTREELGWVVAIHRRMEANPYFGSLHVGTLVDGFGRPEHVPLLLAAGRRYLVQCGVDLIVANWSHHAWVQSSRRLGFLMGPSNFFFFVSAAGKPLLEPSCPLERIHLSRGDCDGPGQLLPPLPA